MEETNNQYDSTNVENDDGTIDESSDTEVEDREDEDKPPICLNNKIILQRLRQNDSEITNLSISLRDNYFNSIDWKEENNGNCISNNTQLKKLSISIGTPTNNIQDLFSCIYRNSSITALSFSSFFIVDKCGGGLIQGLSGHDSLLRLEIRGGRLGSIGCEALVKVLKHPTSKMRDLSLFNCHLD